jgi:hypothetical protein
MNLKSSCTADLPALVEVTPVPRRRVRFRALRNASRVSWVWRTVSLSGCGDNVAVPHGL